MAGRPSAKYTYDDASAEAAKPRRSMDHKITVGGGDVRWQVYICLLGTFCEIRGRIGATFSPWNIL